MQHTPIGVISILAVLFFAMTLVHQKQEADYTYNTAKQQYDDTQARTPIGGSTQRKQTDPKAYREEWRAEQDLKAQRDMADWAYLMLIATCVGTIITSVGIVFLALTLNETRETTRATVKAAEIAAAALVSDRETSEAQVRAYVTILEPSVEFNADIPVFKFRLINSGNSPALRLRADCSFGHAYGEAAIADRSQGAGIIIGTLQQGTPTNGLSIHLGRTIDRPPDEQRNLFLRLILSVSYFDVFKKQQRLETDYVVVVIRSVNGGRPIIVEYGEHTLLEGIIPTE